MDVKYAKHVYILINAHRSIEIATGRKRPLQFTFDVHFTSEEEKEAFTTRLKNVRQLLTPKRSSSIDNYCLFNALLAYIQGAF